jgi:putative transposase
MPSLKTITPLLGGSYYHIFNRGVNKTKIFFNEANYNYFLKLLANLLSPYVHFLSYCLLPNHFHLAVRLKDNIIFKGENISNEEEIGKVVTNQFKKLFITYALAINNQEKRVGSLFNPKFKRIEITEQEYLKYIIFYIHYNPKKHKLVTDFSDYKYSSLKALKSNNKTNLDREYVNEIFDDLEGFLNYHSFWHDEKANLDLE